MGQEIILFIAFALVALVYSIAGLGGASSYIALMVLFAVPEAVMPKVALTCNLIAVTAGMTMFVRAGHFSGRVLAPFAIASIPTAAVMGSTDVTKEWFFGVLSITMLFAGVRMLLTPYVAGTPMERLDLRRVWFWGVPLGGVLGGIAGTVGIGGGIFLAPLLSILHWGTARQIAATCSGFVILTSVAALGGQLWKTSDYSVLSEYLYLYPAVLIGGVIGSLIGARRASVVVVRVLTAALTLGVSAGLFYSMFTGLLTG